MQFFVLKKMVQPLVPATFRSGVIVDYIRSISNVTWKTHKFSNFTYKIGYNFLRFERIETIFAPNNSAVKSAQDHLLSFIQEIISIHYVTVKFTIPH